MPAVLTPVLRGEDGPALAASAGAGMGLRDHQTRVLRELEKHAGSKSRPGVIITVVNRVSVPLQRTEAALSAGQWLANAQSKTSPNLSFFPAPERLVAPHCFTCFAAHGTKSKLVSPSCSGVVEFRISRLHQPIRIAWHVPDSVSQAKKEQTLFWLDGGSNIIRQSDGDGSTATTHLAVETESVLDGLTLQIVATVRENPAPVADAATAVQAAAGLDGQLIRLPMNDQSWISLMAESHRCVLIRFFNRSSRRLIRAATTCTVGAWAMEPPFVIEAGETVLFGSNSCGVMEGTTCAVQFAVASAGDSNAPSGTVDAVDAASVVAASAANATAAALYELQLEQGVRQRASALPAPPVDPLAFDATRNTLSLRWEVPFLGTYRFIEDHTDGFGGFRFHLDREQTRGPPNDITIVNWTLSEIVVDPNVPLPVDKVLGVSSSPPALAVSTTYPSSPGQSNYLSTSTPDLARSSHSADEMQQPPSSGSSTAQQSQAASTRPPVNAAASPEQHQKAAAEIGGQLEIYRRAAQAVVEALTAKAGQKKFNIDNQVGINIYWRQAQHLFEQGQSAMRGGDLDTAFISWMQYLELVIVHLPSHLQFNLMRFDDDRVEHTGRARRLMTEVERIKKDILAREVAAAAADMQAFPPGPRDSVE